MENKKRIAGDGEFRLPRDIIHHVQSFQSEREAARTSLLSKWWYSAWSTRPNLAFELDFQKGIEFAKKTIQRYEDENLKIRSLKVMTQLNPNLDSNDRHPAEELIAKAMKLGAVDLDISYCNESLLVLPDEVLQSKTLARLKIYGWLTVNLPPMKNGLIFSKLKTLSLFHVDIKGDLFRDLIPRCPSIERFELHGCSRDERPRITLSMNDFEKLEFPKLGFLFLSLLEFGQGVLSSPKLWARFSCLKELMIFDNKDKEDVRICSRSLELLTIHLIGDKILNAEFDVPNLRVFELQASPLSRLDFKTCREWESDVRLTCHRDSNDITSSWLSSFKQLLKALRSSRVSLSIDMSLLAPQNEKSGDGFRCDGDAVVETLRLEGDHQANSEFLDKLFSIISRPKRIIEDSLWHITMKKELSEVECEKMVEEEKNVKVLEERFGKYSSLSWKTLPLEEDSTHQPPFLLNCQVIWNLDHSAPSGTSDKIGTIQRRLTWPRMTYINREMELRPFHLHLNHLSWINMLCVFRVCLSVYFIIMLFFFFLLLYVSSF